MESLPANRPPTFLALGRKTRAAIAGGKYQVFTAEILIRPRTQDESIVYDKARHFKVGLLLVHFSHESNNSVKLHLRNYKLMLKCLNPTCNARQFSIYPVYALEKLLFKKKKNINAQL